MLNTFDILNSLKIQGLSNPISVEAIILSLMLTFILAMVVYFTYRTTFSGVLYTRSFNISLVIMSLVTATIIMTISSNLVLSLGMVGVFSIVRFRTAIKDVMDNVYLFWAVSIGLVCGAGQYFIAITGTIAIAVILIFFDKINLTRKSPYLLVLNYDISSDSNVEKKLNTLPGYKIRSKTIKEDNIETVIETRVKETDMQLLNSFNVLEGMHSAVIINYNGDYLS